MANKYFRQNFNKGGGADTGKVGERKSKTAVTVDKLKKRLKRIGRPAPVAGIKGLFDRKPSTIKNKTSKSPMQRQRKLDTLKSEASKRGSIIMSGDEMQKLKGESDKSFKQRMAKAFAKAKEPGGRLSEKDIERAKKALNMKKGGRAKMMGGGMMGRRFGMREGSLKPVDPKTQKGLSKLPTEVRNKMGYMKKGGRA